MRFASLQNSGNGAKYAQAGKAVADSSARVFDTQRKTGPDYAGISKTAMKTAAEEKIAGMKAEASVAKAGINAVADMKQTQIKTEVFKRGEELKNKQRKAGGIAAIGKIAGAGFLAATDNTKGRERPKADLQGFYDSWKTKHDGIKDRHKSESDALGDYQPGTFKAPDTSTGDGSGKVATGESTGSPSSGTSSNLGGQPFDLSKLTDADYDELGYVVSSEAALGTNDEFGVAANVLTRLQSGKYGNSIGEIIRAKGQYEGVYTGNSTYSPEIVARLKSPEGQKKIQDYFQQLNGRTEFKGQTMLHNRVNGEDPMFDPKGNFYHYAGQ
jgi:hypothetical protein